MREIKHTKKALNYDPSLRQRGRTYRQLLEAIKLASSTSIDIVYVFRGDSYYYMRMAHGILSPINHTSDHKKIGIGSSSIEFISDAVFEDMHEYLLRGRYATVFINHAAKLSDEVVTFILNTDNIIYENPELLQS